MNSNYLLIGLGLASIILELLLGVATGFDLFLIGLALLIGGGFGLVYSSSALALWTSATLCLLYVFFGRSIIKDKLKIHTTPTSTDALLGKNAKVTKAIAPDHPGQIKVEGEIWRAESDSALAVGERVVIKSVSGVTLRV